MHALRPWRRSKLRRDDYWRDYALRLCYYGQKVNNL